jgi:hypothetical protein
MTTSGRYYFTLFALVSAVSGESEAGWIVSGSSSSEAGGGAAKLPTASGGPVVIIMADSCGYYHSKSIYTPNENISNI